MSALTESGSAKSANLSQQSTGDYSGGSISQDEPRITWIKTIIANQLGVFDPKHVNALVAKNRQAVEDFLNKRYERQAHLDRVIMYVWRTFYDRLVEEEITVLEEVPRPSAPDKKDKKKKGAKGAAKGKGRKKGGQDAEPAADTEQADNEAGDGPAAETDLEAEFEGEEEATVISSGKSSARSRRK
ncbi:uncharacterized protein LOC117792391 [Drosophila innubila]|uniref:uncharacterized protein LOC117792391 n=1 Tax=Drosophila innubila TaxID=198719 RepID=UPI00148BC6F2|nr:uncharacterized protein LOC117792391 [Drosophila innubila]